MTTTHPQRRSPSPQFLATSWRALSLALLSGTLACSSAAVVSNSGGANGNSNGLGSGNSSGGASGEGGSGGSSGTRPGDPGISINVDAGAAAAIDMAPSSPGAMSCAEEAHDGKMVPLDLLFLVDISGSMEEAAGNHSKWVSVRDALNGFLKDGKSAGLGVGLSFFPLPSAHCSAGLDCPGNTKICEEFGYCGMPPADLTTSENYCTTGGFSGCGLGGMTCTAYGICDKSGLRCPTIGQPCTGAAMGEMCQPRPKLCRYVNADNCKPELYATPVLEIADLPGAADGMAKAFAAITPSGGTPTGPAVQGALQHLAEHAAKTPRPQKRPRACD